MDRQSGGQHATRLRDRPLTAGLVTALGVALLVALPAGPQTSGAAPASVTGAPAGAVIPGPADQPGASPPPDRTPIAGPAGGATWPAPPAAGGPPAALPSALPTAVPAGLPNTAAPQRVRIPDIGVDAPLEALHVLPDGTLEAPREWGDAGWYADGTRPGDVGPAVIAGHIDSTRGPAVFFRLDRLRVGALVEVERAGHWVSFRAVSVAEYPKNAFPSAKVYGPTPDPQLRLITCGGGFDRRRGSYLDNTVVFAVAA